MFVLIWILSCLPLIVCETSFVHRFHVKENTPPGVIIGQLIVQYQKSFTSLAGKPLSDYIFIHPTNGSILTVRPIDREAICQSDEGKNTSFVSQYLDDPACEVVFLVHITTNGESLLESIYLSILDENDNPPVFEPSSITVTIPESSPIGGLFYLPSAKDADLGKNGIINYYLGRVLSDSYPKDCPPYTAYEDAFFTLVMMEDNSPQLRQIGELDYEKFHNLYYCLHAFDGDGLTGALLVNVEIQDVNDNSPQWVGLPYHVHLPECIQQPQQSLWKTNADLRSFLRVSGFAYDTPFRFLVQLTAVDADSKENGHITYSVVQKKPDILAGFKAIVHVDKVYIIGHLDYETTPKFSIAVEARDGGGLTNVTNVEVTLEDCNDNTPKITVTSLSPLPRENLSDWSFYKQTDIWVGEEDDREIKLATITVSDADTGDNAVVNCDMEWNNLLGMNPFSLVPLKPPSTAVKVPTVFILMKKSGIKVDREVISRVKVTIICSDQGHPPNTARHAIDIGVWDINDNPPKFRNNITIGVQENEPEGTVVGYIHASDIDFGVNAVIKYSIKDCDQNDSNLSFGIDERTGKIMTLRTLDREAISSYCITVIAKDGGKPQLSSSTNVNISVLDVNDCPPVFEGNRNESGRIIFEIPESFDQERLVDRFVGQINVTDQDNGANATLEFSIKQPSGPYWHGNSPAYFRITRRGQLHVDGVLDREKQAEHELTVIVSDSAPFHQRLTSKIGVTVRLLDLNDNGPVFTEPPGLAKSPHAGVATVNITLDMPVNSSILRICAKDGDIEESSQLSFTLRCAKYLRPYFDIGGIENMEGSEKCTSLIVVKPLTEMTMGNSIKHSRMPIENQLYITVMDLGFHQFSKTARIRLFIRDDSTIVTPEVPNKHQELDKDGGTIAKHAWTHSLDDQKRSYQTKDQVSNINRTLHAHVGANPNSFLGQTKAKYVFIVAVVIFVMFIVVLGLLAYLFIRDFPSKRHSPNQQPSGENESDNLQYSACRTVPIVYTADYREGSVSLSKFQLSTQQGGSATATAVSASEPDTLHSHAVLQLTPHSTTSRIINSSQQEYQLRECKPSEIGSNFSETEDGSMPMIESPGSNTRNIPLHITRNRMFQTPVIDRSGNFLAKYATSPVYAPIHSEKAIFLKSVSPSQQQAALTGHKQSGGRQHDYGFLPTTLVLSEINDTYTSLSGSTQRKQQQQQTGHQTLEFNEI
ncbi:hypothetical protein Aperf_G00000033788 [Anoplocephala perfoliata]